MSLHVVVTFSKSGDGWMMEMDDDSVEIERSQHASTTQRGRERQCKNRTGGSETGYK